MASPIFVLHHGMPKTGNGHFSKRDPEDSFTFGDAVFLFLTGPCEIPVIFRLICLRDEISLVGWRSRRMTVTRHVRFINVLYRVLKFLRSTLVTLSMMLFFVDVIAYHGLTQLWYLNLSFGTP